MTKEFIHNGEFCEACFRDLLLEELRNEFLGKELDEMARADVKKFLIGFCFINLPPPQTAEFIECGESFELIIKATQTGEEACIH
jgi:hypothetical protein